MYTDGGSRGNPGPSALGVFLETLHVRYGEYLGRATNNEAEYRAILSGMRKTREILGDIRAKGVVLECRMDSELAMRQLSGRYRVKHPNLRKFFEEIQREAKCFSRVRFVHVLREKNKEADAEVNRALDEALSRNKS